MFPICTSNITMEMIEKAEVFSFKEANETRTLPFEREKVRGCISSYINQIGEVYIELDDKVVKFELKAEDYPNAVAYRTTLQLHDLIGGLAYQNNEREGRTMHIGDLPEHLK